MGFDLTMPNILAQLPASLKERVSISRENADDDEPDIEVASDVECYINPESDLITLDRGVGARFLTYKMHVGAPVDGLSELDTVIRSDGSKLQVYRVRSYGTAHMNVILRSRGIV